MLYARVLLCCLLAAALSACAAGRRTANDGAAGPGLEDVAGRTYHFASMDGKNFEGADAPLISFDGEGRVSGRACNSFNGAAEIVDGVMTVKKAAATRMACRMTFLNDLERILLGMLQNGAFLRLDGRNLTLERDGHALTYALPSPKP